MAIRRRTTEKHPHPVWEKLVAAYNIVEVEGFIFDCNNDELIAATKSKTPCIQFHCIEAVECDTKEEFNYLHFFDEDNWLKKVSVAKFFNAPLKLISHIQGDEYLFRVHDIDRMNGQLSFNETKQFEHEADFIAWWSSFKKLTQHKKQVEAKPRQKLTIIDAILEKHGLQWGGNIDAFVLNENNKDVISIIELRQSRKMKPEDYDPAAWFSGTHNRGGDFKTWLPLVYLQKAWHLPLVLITVSTVDETKLGYTEVRGINEKKLFYVEDISPTKNVTSDFGKFKTWFSNLIFRIR